MKPRLPKWNKAKSKWIGGDSRTLYTFTDSHTGRSSTLPPTHIKGVGEHCTVRIATREEAERPTTEGGWQSPLHSGWHVAEHFARGREPRKERQQSMFAADGPLWDRQPILSSRSKHWKVTVRTRAPSRDFIDLEYFVSADSLNHAMIEARHLVPRDHQIYSIVSAAEQP